MHSVSSCQAAFYDGGNRNIKHFHRSLFNRTPQPRSGSSLRARTKSNGMFYEQLGENVDNQHYAAPARDSSILSCGKEIEDVEQEDAWNWKLGNGKTWYRKSVNACLKMPRPYRKAQVREGT